MTRELSVVLAGIGGYGRTYLRHLLDPRPGEFRLAAVADPAAERSDRYPDVLARGIPVFRSLDELYCATSADLAVISTPVQLHAEHVKVALANGSHVLCEKPLASSMADVRQLIAARDAARRFVAIGYQWSFTPAVLQLRRDIADGLFGKPLRMRTLVLWPRTQDYYRRNGWAGRVRDERGLPVLDSPLNNACAHFAHNVFFVLGAGSATGAGPASVTAELYRANPIENYDTAAVRCTIAPGNCEALFVLSHAVAQSRGPVLRYEFERGVVTYDEDSADGAQLVARLADGTTKNYGGLCPSDDPGKIWHVMECIRTNRPPVCGIEEAAEQTALVCAAQESMPQISAFPDSMIRVTQASPPSRGALHSVTGLEEVLADCHKRMMLPSEMGVPWARAGRTVRVG